MKRRLDHLILDIRNQTHTQDFSSTEGIPNDTMVHFFRYANKALRGLIYGGGFDEYIATTTTDIVSSQEAYSLPSDSFLKTNVISVEYKYGQESGDYRKLDRASLHLRDTTYDGTPLRYIQHDNQILINPPPASAVTDGLRITYEHRLPDLDIRRGIISSTTGNPITAITLDLTPSLTKDSGIVTAGASVLTTADYITIVDKDGTVLMDDIPIDNYDTSTGIITITSGFTPDTGETSPAGAYVVEGDYASTHSSFPDFCEMYLISYVKYLVYRHNGHPDLPYAEREMKEQSLLIIEVFGESNKDINYIGIIDRDHRLLE
jgi:hypothetical protein